MPVSTKTIQVFTCAKCGHEEELTNTSGPFQGQPPSTVQIIKPEHKPVQYTWQDGGLQKNCDSCGGPMSRCLIPTKNPNSTGTTMEYKCLNEECPNHPLGGIKKEEAA